MIDKMIQDASEYIHAMKNESLPIAIEAKITIDFGKGIKRRYEIVNDPRCKGMMDGKHYQIEFCHPNFGEVFIARKI